MAGTVNNNEVRVATTCNKCGRAVWTMDVNREGKCSDCAPPLSAAKVSK